VISGRCHTDANVGNGDNNEAEWSALLYAIRLATEAGVREAVFVGDSTLVIEQAKGRWKCRSEHLKPYLAAFRTAIEPIECVKLRQVHRSRNLAGIALAALGKPDSRPFGAPATVC
jgi:ribonuclease HI